MITIEKPIDLPDTYPLDRIGPLEELLFFDIETTGFSGDYSSLYLVGCTYYKGGAWHLVQWFADTRDSEEGLLHAFFAFLGQYQILVHFNGDGFDIPFLLKRCRHFGLSYDFSGVESFDIYKRIRPFRKLLGLESMKQKAIEQFLGVERQDRFSGGQLVEVYEDYLHSQDRHLYDLLILHNEDDLKGMPRILPVLSYPDFLEHDFSLVSWQVSGGTQPAAVSPSPADPRPSAPDPSSGSCPSSAPTLELVCQSSFRVPVPFAARSGLVWCRVQDCRLYLTVRLYQGIMKHFYPNYKDYYYLVYEDTAVHKSVGEYVDRSARTRATAATCYTRMEGTFVPQFVPIWEPVMKLEPRDRLPYVPLEQMHLEDPDAFRLYVKELLAQLVLHCGNNGE